MPPSNEQAAKKAWGGKRIGAGTLTKANRDERARKSAAIKTGFDLKCIADLPDFYEAAKQLALGVYVEKETLDGKIRVYQEKPDRATLTFLMENAIGKAVARQQATIDTELKLVVNHPRPGRRGQNGLVSERETVVGGDGDGDGDEEEALGDGEDGLAMGAGEE